MSDHVKSEAYEQARSAFDALKMDERAAFLVESVVAMMADGVGEAGRVVSQVIDEMADHLDRCSDEEAGETEPSEAASPEEPKRSRTKSQGTSERKASSRSKKAG